MRCVVRRDRARRCLLQRRCHLDNGSMQLPPGGQLHHLASQTSRGARYHPFLALGLCPRRPSLVHHRRPPRHDPRPVDVGIVTGRRKLPELLRLPTRFPTSHISDIVSCPLGAGQIRHFARSMRSKVSPWPRAYRLQACGWHPFMATSSGSGLAILRTARRARTTYRPGRPAFVCDRADHLPRHTSNPGRNPYTGSHRVRAPLHYASRVPPLVQQHARC